jgi:hypothetical protein
MNWFSQMKQRVFARNAAKGPDLPTEREINPNGNSYDGQHAVEHFLGKTRPQITREWAEHGHHYEEDLWAMGDEAFCFYLPAVVDYVTGNGSRDADAVSDLCRVIESRLKYHLPGIRKALPEVLRFADYVLAHFGDYEGLSDDLCGDLRPRLMAIKLKCAEPTASPTGGHVEPADNSDGREGPASAS